jgi:hypothetical protein
MIALSMGVLYMFIQPIVSASRHRWPIISNQESLLRDAKSLLGGNDRKEIESNRWTTSVSMLKPRIVFGGNDYLEITISAGGIGPSWGYLVFPDKRTSQYSSPDFRILGAEGPGIYRYETIE